MAPTLRSQAEDALTMLSTNLKMSSTTLLRIIVFSTVLSMAQLPLMGLWCFFSLAAGLSACLILVIFLVACFTDALILGVKDAYKVATEAMQACSTSNKPASAALPSNGSGSKEPTSAASTSTGSTPTGSTPTGSTPTATTSVGQNSNPPTSTAPTPTSSTSAAAISTAQSSNTTQRLDFRNFTIIERGVTPEGDRWDKRLYHQPGSSSASNIGFHISYTDGSYAYRHPDGSKYCNDGQGWSHYTRADGSSWAKQQYTASSNESSAPTSAQPNQDLTTLGLITDASADTTNTTAGQANNIDNLTQTSTSTPTVLTSPSLSSDASSVDGDAPVDNEEFEILGYEEAAASHGTEL